jgi:hypothetical protein
MPQYLVVIQHPENYDPSLEGEVMIRDASFAGAYLTRSSQSVFDSARRRPN